MLEPSKLTPCPICGGVGAVGVNPAVECEKCGGYGYIPEIETKPEATINE